MFTIFRKQKNSVKLVAVIDKDSKDEALELVNERDSFYPRHVSDALSSSDFCYATNTQMEEGGCYFVIEGHDKAINYWRDELWIMKIKQDAKIYTDKSFYYIEAQRRHRQGKNIDKCVNRIKAKFPGFTFIVEHYNHFEGIAKAQIKGVI